MCSTFKVRARPWKKLAIAWRCTYYNVCSHSFTSASCHLDKASNDEFSVEYLFWFFQLKWKADLKVVQNDLFWVNAPLWYLEWAQIVKHLKKITITNIWHSTPISTFDALSIWHEPDINVVYMSTGDLLIWRNFEFWSTNICFLFF